MSRKTIAEHAAEHLIETGNTGIFYGDSHLFHEIAERAGIGHKAWHTERCILNALSYHCRTAKEPLFEEWKDIRTRARQFRLKSTDNKKETNDR